MIREGMFIADRYEVLGKIGAGGMSDVYKAKDQVLGRFVAIKVLKQEYSEDTTFVSKFHAEASAAAGLEHPNIVNVYDVGSEEGMYYIVMEYIEGVTLKTYIEKKGQLSYKEAISIAIQVGRGIEAAHLKQIIHRDIKPQNIMISTDGKVKVTDFGIARAASSNTIHSDVMGSVHYTSPEQARNGYVDYKSDIYSLGIVMYEMVTGRVPFDGDTAVAVAIQHLQEDMVPPSAYALELPHNLEMIILKCTQKNPDRRYQSMGDLLADLKRALINPEDDFVVINDGNMHGATRVMQEKEVQQIKMQAAQIQIPNIDRGGMPQEESVSPAKQQRQPMPQKPPKPQKQPRRIPEAEPEEDYYEDEFYDDDDDFEDEKGGILRPGMEKVVTILGIVAAIVIVIIIVYLLINLFGVFPGSNKKNTNTETETQVQTEVSTIVSEAPEQVQGVTMVELRGMSYEAAQKTLNDMGLGIFLIGYQASDDYPKDQIMSQDVMPGETVPANTTVKVYVSSGAGNISIPNVVGQSYADAESNLKNAGFEVNRSDEYSESVEAGMVISTTPSAGANGKAGDTITVRVSQGKEPITTFTMPNYQGLDQAAAVNELQNTYQCKVTVNQEYNPSFQPGKVIATSPAAGSTVQNGSDVMIAVSKGSQTYSYSVDVTVPGETVTGVSYRLVGSDGTTIIPDTTVTAFNTDMSGNRVFNISASNIASSSGQLYISWILADGSTQNNATYPVNATFTQTN